MRMVGLTQNGNKIQQGLHKIIIKSKNFLTIIWSQQSAISLFNFSFGFNTRISRREWPCDGLQDSAGVVDTIYQNNLNCQISFFSEYFHSFPTAFFFLFHFVSKFIPKCTRTTAVVEFAECFLNCLRSSACQNK